MTEVHDLFRQAIERDDAAAMRTGLEQLFSGGGGVSAAEEFALRHEEYVLEMPQSGERITGRERMRAMQDSFPGPPPGITISQVSGAGRTWFVEAVNEYAPGDRWHIVLALEFSPDGRMVHDRRYYAQDFEPPTWRAAFTDPP